MDKTQIEDVADTMRVCVSLSKILRSLDAIRERTSRSDFVTRRCHRLAMDALFRIDPERVRIGDLDRAFVEASIGVDTNESPDQHACRYMTRVLGIAARRAVGRPLCDLNITTKVARCLRPQ